MTTETRYFKNASIINNGLTCNNLATTQSTTATSMYTERGAWPVYWGIRVWHRTSAGAEDEITSGTPVAQVSRSSNGEGSQSGTWTPTAHVLALTDSIVVRVYYKIGTGAWTLIDTWQTEDLNTTILNAETWTVSYYTRTWSDAENDYLAFYWGSSTYNSLILNFTYGVTIHAQHRNKLLMSSGLD